MNSPSRWVTRSCFLAAMLCLLSQALQAETPVDLQLEPQKAARGGATVAVVQTPEGNGIKLTVDYPEGEGGGGFVAYNVEGFEGPLSHITFNIRGNMSMARIGVRGFDKGTSLASVKMPDLDEVMQPHSVDLTAAIQTAEAGGQPFTYPITEVIIGFRYGDKPQDFLEISDLVLHPVE